MKIKITKNENVFFEMFYNTKNNYFYVKTVKLLIKLLIYIRLRCNGTNTIIF